MSDPRAVRSYGDCHQAVVALVLLKEQFVRLGFPKTTQALAATMRIAEAEATEHFTAADRERFERERRRKRSES